MKNKKLKEDLIKALADFIAKDAGMKSIYLEMDKPMAKDWARIRSATNFSGVTVEDAEKHLRKILLE